MTNELRVGTLILDNGKIGIVVKVIKSGSLNTRASLINWRNNYEIYYFDGVHAVMGTETVNRLINEGRIVVVDEGD